MLLRLLAGAALFYVGYYMGREIGRGDTVRESLGRAREAGVSREITDDEAPDDTGDDGPAPS
ncbi:MAG: hypothetical protein ABFS23_11600 [Pseudomonadota bacterium]